MKIIQEFKEFIARGNVLDLAVAVIIGGAFNAIITSFVTDLINPLLSLFTGGVDFASLAISWGSGDNPATFYYGKFIAAVINFLLVAVVIFLMVKIVNKISSRKQDPPTEKECPYCAQMIPIAAVRCPLCTTILDPKAVPEELR